MSLSLYDVEKGPSSPPFGATARSAKRLVVRRFRWLLIGTLISLIFVWFYDFGPPRGLPRDPPLEEWGEGLEGIWADDGEASLEPEEGEAWGHRLPSDHQPDLAKTTLKSQPVSPQTYTVDEYGDHFFQPSLDYIAPFHPDVSLLPLPSFFFPEVKLPTFLRPAESVPYPDERLREVISDPLESPAKPPARGSIAASAFSQKWEAPKVWDEPRGEVRRVQWEGFAGGRDRWETAAEAEVRKERKEAVRRGFAWAWQAYKDHAWGHDEIKPISQVPSDPFNGWGASIIDSLDTLLVMGFTDEYNACRPHVNQLNFNWVTGRDWSQAYTSETELDGEDEESTTVWEVPRDRSTGLAVFETCIRYLGGMLGAYDLSGDALLLERAVDLAEVLGKAFNTPSGLPAGRIDPGLESGVYSIGSVSIAEVGSMALELTRLSQITRDRKWYDLAQRAMDYLETRVIPRGVHVPLIPLWFAPDAALTSQMVGALAFGGLADSYYEYLIKVYRLLGGGENAAQYRRIYEQSIDKAKEVLFVEIDTVPDRDILAIGKLEHGRLIPEIEHLTCFAGAMLGLGSKLLARSKDMVDALRFTQSCYWLSAATPTGLQPEVVEFFPSDSQDRWQNVSFDTGLPHVLFEEDALATNQVHRDREGVLRWNEDDTLAVRESELEGSPVEYTTRLKGSPAGAKKVVGRGINRPETIESIFYMYRLTGDRKWQEKGWQMYTSWVTAAKVAGGISSVEDVTKADFRYSDNMESFMFAETMKYHFLLQSEPDLLSLDDYVLNTEAHPMIANPSLVPGSQRMWTPQSSQDLGVRAQGTDAQKWMRLEVLRKARHIRKRWFRAVARAWEEVVVGLASFRNC